MSDTNEERLLSDLLHDIAQDDARLAPPADLEPRLMARWDARKRSRVPFFTAGLLAIAAAALLAIAMSVPAPSGNRADKADLLSRKPVVIAEAPEEPRLPDIAEPEPRHPAARRPRMARQLARPASEVVDFIPLGPLGPSELSGSFQIVPVRINNTPAHLLLGEDGMAQGILWRSR